jgi:hypothetical protein
LCSNLVQVAIGMMTIRVQRLTGVAGLTIGTATVPANSPVGALGVTGTATAPTNPRPRIASLALLALLMSPVFLHPVAAEDAQSP